MSDTRNLVPWLPAVMRTRAQLAARSRTSFTASSLNSRLNFRRCISILQFQKHLILVSTEPAAAHRDAAWLITLPDMAN